MRWGLIPVNEGDQVDEGSALAIVKTIKWKPCELFS